MKYNYLYITDDGTLSLYSNNNLHETPMRVWEGEDKMVLLPSHIEYDEDKLVAFVKKHFADEIQRHLSGGLEYLRFVELLGDTIIGSIFAVGAEIWDPEDYLQGDDCGITPSSTDEEIARIASEIEDNTPHAMAFEPSLVEHLTSVRDSE